LSCCRLLYEHKIIVNVDGMELNVIKIKPPLVFTKEDCIHFMESLDIVLSN
jgi:4-aminobutyrate aminotransferase-like enzyme